MSSSSAKPVVLLFLGLPLALRIITLSSYLGSECLLRIIDCGLGCLEHQLLLSPFDFSLKIFCNWFSHRSTFDSFSLLWLIISEAQSHYLIEQTFFISSMWLVKTTNLTHFELGWNNCSILYFVVPVGLLYLIAAVVCDQYQIFVHLRLKCRSDHACLCRLVHYEFSVSLLRASSEFYYNFCTTRLTTINRCSLFLL